MNTGTLVLTGLGVGALTGSWLVAAGIIALALLTGGDDTKPNQWHLFVNETRRDQGIVTAWIVNTEDMIPLARRTDFVIEMWFNPMRDFKQDFLTWDAAVEAALLYAPATVKVWLGAPTNEWWQAHPIGGSR